MRNSKLSSNQRGILLSPMSLGFYTTLVLEAAEKRLAEDRKLPGGTTQGAGVDLRDLVTSQLGAEEARDYGLS